jgi:murein DD-endopeptidase MepM/ murein hydrolase activator NlpD
VGRDDYDDEYDDDAGYTGYTDYTGARPGYTGEYETGYATGYTGAYDAGYSEQYSAADRALVVRGGDSEYLPAEYDDDEDDEIDATGPVVIPGSGMPMGDPMLGRNHRSLTMRVAVLTLMGALLVSALFAVTPLGSSANGASSSFQALSGVVVLHADVSYHFYIAQWNDTPESVAAKFHVQVGGIYKLNDLLAGQELTVGKAYRIPDDPNYGADYRPPPAYQAVAVYGETTYGDSSWTSHAGEPPPEVPCGVDGHGVPTAYQLKSPNYNSNWVRGFTWFHNGVDLSNPLGTPLHAAQAGEVIWAGWANDGFGYSVKINHCYHISTVYGHMEQLLVKVHDVVQPGDVIGLEGSTGWSTGPHVHLMVEVDNVPVDPMPYYGYNRAAITGQGLS